MRLAFKSETHLGDCILHAHFLRQLIKKNPQIERIYLYQYADHLKQTQEFTRDIPQIVMARYDAAPENALRGWVGQFGIPPLPCALDTLRFTSYNKLCKQLNLRSPFWALEDILLDHPNFYRLENFDRYDVLLINSTPLSNQCTLDEEQYTKFAAKLKAKGKTVITTKKIPGVDCTMDKGYSILDIGCLSIKAKYIIGIGTGPMIGCLNVRNKEKKFLYIDQHHYFDLPYFQMIQSLDQIDV